MEFNQTLQKIRKDRKISQEELAARLGLSRQAIAKWENGIAFPDINNLIRLSEIFCVTIDRLVKESANCSNLPLTQIDFNTAELIKFVKEANSHTYAASKMEADTVLYFNAHTYLYEQGSFKYIDSFVGGAQFSGGVIVYKDDNPKWSMNFAGRTLEEQFSIDFLKEVLLNMPEHLPIRGAKLYKRGDFTYHNDFRGTFSWYYGTEQIFYDQLKVYEGVYHGGIVL